MNRRGILRAILLPALLAGCVSSRGGGPPRVRYGEDVCAECRMIISEERFAAAYRARAGEWRVFDDIGCLVRALSRETDGAPQVWVHDYGGSAWIEGRGAVYVASRELASPMGYGLAAFPSRAAAEAVAHAVHGQVMGVDGLPAFVGSSEQAAGRPAAASGSATYP